MIFWLLERTEQTEKLKNLERSVKTSGEYLSLINLSLTNIFTIFYDLLVSRNPHSKPKNHEVCEIRAIDFLDSESTWDSTDVQAPIYDRKTAAKPFYTTHEIIRSLSLVQSLHKGRNAPLWRKREPTHVRLSGTDGLNDNFWLERV